MSVKDTLDKIVERHADVIGAMVVHNGTVHHNLEEPYDMISADAILETFSEILEHTTMLADEGYDFGELMLDFANHSFIVRAIDDGLLAVLAPRLQRGQLVKLHVGLGLHAKAVQKALNEAPSVEAAAPEPAPVAAEPAAPEPVQPVVAEPAVEAPSAEAAPADESSMGRNFQRKRGGFRGTKAMLAARVEQAIAATTAPKPKEPEPEEQVNEDGVPLNADGTPKKRKMYRGQVYYE